MTVIPELPPTPPDTILWDGRFSAAQFSLVNWGLTADVWEPLIDSQQMQFSIPFAPETGEDDRPQVQLVTGSREEVRLNSPSLFAGDAEYWIAVHLNAPASLPHETTMVANIAGLLVELPDDGTVQLTSPIRDPETGSRAFVNLPWSGDDHLFVVQVLMSENPEIGYYRCELDGEYAWERKGQTWGHDLPRAWMVSLLNVRDELSMGSYRVASRGVLVGNTRAAVEQL